MAVPIRVDFGRRRGTIRPLNGVNFGPRYTNGLDLSARFAAAGFSSVRLHDCRYVCPETVDVHSIFPLFHLDENNPANYRFGPTDDYVAAVKAIGAEIVYRLGESIEHQRPQYHVHPPADFEKWARVCCRIIEHYNEGWAGGIHHGIRYWEVWNEAWHPGNWTGSAQDYYRLYEVVSKAIRREFPGVKVGGPADGEGAGPFGRSFLKYCREHGCPLDFYTWHTYARSPREIVERTRAARQMLDNFGFGDTELHLNEWNAFPEEDWSWRFDPSGRAKRFFERLGSAEGAAFAAAVLCLLQDERVDMANWYAPYLGRWGMFGPYQEPLKTYYAFLAFGRLLETPIRVATEGGDASIGLGVCAGLQTESGTGTLMLANWGVADGAFDVSISGLARATRCEVSILDESHDLELMRSEAVPRGGGTVRCEAPGPTVWVLRLVPVE